MSIFNEIYQKLFAKEDATPVVIHELLHRNEDFHHRKNEWEVLRKENQLRDIRNSSLFKLKGIEQQPPVHVLNTPYANGLAISMCELFEYFDLAILQEYFADQTKSLGYKVVNRDLTIHEKNKYIERIEKIYLKPEVTAEYAPIDQKYGNVLLENISIDEIPSYLKLSVMVYSDRLYQTARPYSEYLDYLLNPN